VLDKIQRDRSVAVAVASGGMYEGYLGLK